MAEELNLKEIEKKIWTSYFEDGLWDIFLGLILVNLGISPFFESIGIPSPFSYLILLVVAYTIFYIGKKYVTLPRMGQVKFGSQRQAKRKKISILLILSVVGGLLLIVFPITNIMLLNSSIPLAAILFMINAIVVFGFMAYLLDFPRLYLYGIFFAASILLIEISKPSFGSEYDNIIGFGTFGSIIVIIGLFYFIKFLRKYKPIDDFKEEN